MSNEPFPVIRSHLYGPGNNAKILSKIFDTESDAVILDLEDAVPHNQKELARNMVAEIISEHSQEGQPYCFVRINHPSLHLVELEIDAITQKGLFGIRIPKVETNDDIHVVENFLKIAEQKKDLQIGSIKIICNIESSKGILNASSILQASDRVVGFAFGAADFAKDIGVWQPDDFSFLYPKSHLVITSSAHTVQPPIDSVYANLNDESGLKESSALAKNLGFFGRSAIHPKQVPIINEIYTPTTEEIKKAQSIIDALEKAEQNSKGAIDVAGDFVDIAIVKKAEGIINLAQSLDLI
ncbi:MAG: hypothetical protein CL779_00070 [Chloroflexi bacterium]|nr:hypothetical protein [Chloroflexota bacterium]|tara:strand:+ start:139 stop:1029 length:891 start_codon:yes stop_codon:yes gene_type:complete